MGSVTAEILLTLSLLWVVVGGGGGSKVSLCKTQLMFCWLNFNFDNI